MEPENETTETVRYVTTLRVKDASMDKFIKKLLSLLLFALMYNLMNKMNNAYRKCKKIIFDNVKYT